MKATKKEQEQKLIIEQLKKSLEIQKDANEKIVTMLKVSEYDKQRLTKNIEHLKEELTGSKKAFQIVKDNYEREKSRLDAMIKSMFHVSSKL